MGNGKWSVTFELLSKTHKVYAYKQIRLHCLLLRISRCQVNFAVNTAAQVLGDGRSGATHPSLDLTQKIK